MRSRNDESELITLLIDPSATPKGVTARHSEHESSLQRRDNG